MKFHKFKPSVKYGLFLILIISLAGTANADTGHPGGIALSWDDVLSIDPCYQNLQTFQKYNASCTINVNTNDLSGFGQSTINNLDALHSAGWEIAAHGHNHVDSVAFLKTHTSNEWLNQEIFPNIVQLTGYGYPVYSFAYPLSERNPTTDALLFPYFRTLRSTAFETMSGTDVNKSTAYYKWDDTQVLYAVEIDDKSGASLQSIQYGIDYAIQNGYVLVLYGHKITSSTPSEYQTSKSRLESILNYTQKKGGTFYHMGDLGNSSWDQSSPGSSNLTANFTISSDNILVGESVTFRDYSVNQTSEVLDFGDGSATSSTANVVHTYTKPGNYKATLTVSNDVYSKSMTKTITVIQPIIPVANFTSNLTTGVPPLNVAFTDTSTGSPTSWLWDFGDGATSTVKNPTHTLSVAGNYNVNLTVSNLNGTTSKTAIITVLQDQGGNGSKVLPVADFSTNVTGGYAPLSVLFTDLSQNTTSKIWDVNNDGVVDSTETSFVYEYAYAGTYTAKLTAINANGTNEKTAVITVLQKPVIPVANFTSNLTSGTAPLTVAFTDTSTGLPASWSWNFGDGSTSDKQNPTHTYSAAGSYNVNLTAINANGMDSKIAVITVLQEQGGNESKLFPVADFSTSATRGDAPISVTFTDLSQNATGWNWDFGDGTISDEQNPTHTYSAAGTYTAKLTASNLNGENSKTATIFVDRKSSGGSSHGGGAGGSPEPAKNVEVKELSQVFITNGKPVKFEFTKNATCVVCVGFDAKKTAGKTTTIAEQLKGKSSLVSGLPEGEVYKSFNVWVGNSGYATSNSIENRVLCFKVEKAWIQDKKIDKDSIALNRYSNKKWEKLPVSLSGEDNKYLYFKSSVPGYSSFAITGKTTANEAENEINKTGDVISPKPETQKDKQNNTQSEVNQTSVRRTRAPGFEMIYCIIGLLGVFLYKRR